MLITAGPSRTAIMPSSDIELAPPLASGELREYVDAGHSAILILDGVFDQSLAVTVAEIRECIRRGARVFGATSMGALRAVEAEPIGMVGIGPIFQLVRRGEITSDADLALAFTTEYRALTVPLVNVRHLCRQMAWATGADEEMHRFYEAARRIHFSERSAVALQDLAREMDGELAGLLLASLTPDCLGCWDLKAHDAAVAVATLRDLLASGRPASGVRRACSPASPERLLAGGVL